MRPVETKNEITIGNAVSIFTTLVSMAVMLVTVTMAYGRLTTTDELYNVRITTLEQEIAARKVAEKELERQIGGMQGDIRVIRQILEGTRVPLK